MFLSSAKAADQFDWRSVGPAQANFVSPVANQGSAGTCWAFSAAAALEAKYQITRNDPSYSPNVSEQNLVCPGYIGSTTSGYAYSALSYITSYGVVSEAELPYTAGATSPLWPLQPNWSSRVWKSTSNMNFMPGGTTAQIKADLAAYGPVITWLQVDNNWYDPAPGAYRADHYALIVGYVDDSNLTAGGYWIVKNSWGTAWGSGGYGKVLYGVPESYNNIMGIDGAVYYTGAMATATWQGGGQWAAGGGQWVTAASPYSWENKETAAIFAGTGGTTTVALSGTIIAHSLAFQPLGTGSAGYSLSGGALTVTAGGITARESATIDSPLTVGGPQTWTVAAGKTLTLGTSIHTVISTLTVAGQGDTTILGAVDGGGTINALGAPAGGWLLTSSGTLSLAGAAGVIQQAASVSIISGRLLLDNSTANNADRLADAIPLVMQGGELALVGNSLGTTEAMGNLTLGTASLTALTVTASNSPAVLMPATVVRGTGATALVRGDNLGAGGGGAAARIQFATAPALSNAGSGDEIGIVPYLVGATNPAGSGTGLVTYDAYGLRLLAESEYNSGLVANKNVRLAASQAASGDLTVRSLVLANQGAGTQAAVTGVLTIASGAILSLGTTGNSIQSGALCFPYNQAAGNEGIITTIADLTIQSTITNTGGSSLALTKSGSGTLTLSNSNSYTGPTTVNAGTLRGGTSAALGTGALVINGGTVDIGSYQDTVGIVTLMAGSITGSSGNLLTSVGSPLLAGYQFQSGTVSTNLGGTRQLIKSSSGTVLLSGSNTFTNSVTINGGTLAVSLLANGGQPSGLGASGSAAGNLTIKDGTLTYVGSGGATGTTDRLFIIGAAGATLDASGAGAVNFSNTGSIQFSALGGATSRTLTLTGSNTGANTLAAKIADTNASLPTSLVKSGSGLWVLRGSGTYSGSTLVAGGTLLANGPITSTPVTVAAGAALGGYGAVRSIMGPGLIAPGAGQGILTTGSLDPTAGTDFAFEFTAGSPSYANPSNSFNDLLRLTDSAAPLTAILGAANDVDVYFDLPSLTAGSLFKGGFYTDLAADFFASIAAAHWDFFVEGDGHGTHWLDGQGYYTLAEYDPSLDVAISTLGEHANFASGGVDGRVAAFSVTSVPEPTALALLAAGALMLGLGGVVGTRRVP
jgi:autotransporter-associated beta strand protein